MKIEKHKYQCHLCSCFSEEGRFEMSRFNHGYYLFKCQKCLDRLKSVK